MFFFLCEIDALHSSRLASAIREQSLNVGGTGVFDVTPLS